ncbi:MAG: hypothetical protein WDW38_009134 [Sanguina aurantia]
MGPSVPASSPSASKPAVAKTPIQQSILNNLLGISNVPYSSYVPSDTPLHQVDARIKQMWLVALYLMISRAPPLLRLAITATVAAATILNFPARLWKPQLGRLGLLCLFIFACTALGADGVPGVLQPRCPPPELLLDGISTIAPTGYSYVILHVLFVTITHKSLNLAFTAACLTFCALQAASLCLVTTPGEEMALAVRWWLSPLRAFGVPVREVAMTLLLSLRFMSLVFEEVRNLCLGLAARGVDWVAQGGRGSLEIAGKLCVKLFANLFRRSENIAQAMVVRGFRGPEDHNLYMMQVNRTNVLANTVALGLLIMFIGLVCVLK